MDEIIKINSRGAILTTNIADVMQDIFLNIPNFLHRDVFILVSEKIKAYSDFAYSNGLINFDIYSKIRIKKDILDDELQIIEIKNFDGISTIIAKLDNYK